MTSSRSRGLPDWTALPPPLPCLRVSVVIPVRNEARRLPGALRALAAQCNFDGTNFDRGSFEIIVLANNCSDRSAAIVRAFAARCPGLALHVVEVRFPPRLAHVGQARSSLMNLACRRLCRTAGDRGVIASTDGDTRVAPDWLAATLAEIDAGADAVGGRIGHDDDVALPGPLQQLARRDVTYQRLRARLEHALDPDDADPWPRHHQHFGASLAVTAGAYRRCGGMPAEPFLEDEALYRRLRHHDMRVRHSEDVRVVTSSRRSGRVAVGLSWQLCVWHACTAARQEPAVDHPHDWAETWRERQRLRAAWGEREQRRDTGANELAGAERRALLALAERLQTSERRLVSAWRRADSFGIFWHELEPLVLAGAQRRGELPMNTAIAVLRKLIAGQITGPSSRTGRAGIAAAASP